MFTRRIEHHVIIRVARSNTGTAAAATTVTAMATTATAVTAVAATVAATAAATNEEVYGGGNSLQSSHSQGGDRDQVNGTSYSPEPSVTDSFKNSTNPVKPSSRKTYTGSLTGVMPRFGIACRKYGESE
jgi:hypothetical protein